jgi:hypothetical protein
MGRGIVLSPKFSHLPTGGVLFNSAVDELELRKYLLYWDKINVPESSYLKFDCHEFRFLQSVGVLDRTPYGKEYGGYALHIQQSHSCNLNINTGGNTGLGIIDDCTNTMLNRRAGDEILRAHEDVYMLLNAKTPGFWSKGQMSSSLMTFDSENKLGIELNLYNALPVPSVDTSLDCIVRFKESREDELIAFRYYLDGIYKSVINSGDLPVGRAFNSEMSKLNLTLRDLDRTMKESKIKVAAGSLKSVMSGMDGILGAGAGLAGIATLLNLSPVVAGLSGAGIALAAKLIPQSKSSIPKELTYLKSIKCNF